ncbi:hypothetical protein MTR_8g027132 [Medicago truncatula]|uniref:RNase H type-1 domain-containing protein n=1 Tax=Medicago truncatula TaxID=3880 RepID=A0A072TYH5_MEDTR|nr:hypothetical protein MTR_8g027132 [Medicago truncatula]
MRIFIVHVLALCYEIWCARNKKCFEGIDVDVAATIQKAQRSIVNFKSAGTMLVETLSRGPILPISDVHWTPPFSGFYKLNIDAAGPIEGDKGDSGVVEALAMRKGLKFVKDVCFLNLIAESDASNVVLALNAHQQSPNYVGSIIQDCIV